MQWWRSPQWRSLVENVEDPSSARLALAACAHEINFIGNGMDREHLAKACETPAVVMAFHSVGDDQSYPIWASDSLDTWESNTKALVAAGIPEPVAGRRAALVFGTTEVNRDYIKAASDNTISDTDLMVCADSALMEQLSQYVAHPVAKAEQLWDESSVNRDNLGQFAEKDKLAEGEQQGHSFQVIGGRKYKIREKSKERVKVKEEEPERVERKTSDKELLSHQAQYAEARKKKEAEKAKRNARIQQAARLRTAAQGAARQKEMAAAKERQAEAARQKAAVRETPKGKVKAQVQERQRSRAKLRMGRKERIPTEFDPNSNPPLPPTDALTEKAKKDVEHINMGLGLNHEPVMLRSHEQHTTLHTQHTDQFPFKNPGVNLVADSRGDTALVADMGVYLENIIETVQKNVDQIGEDIIGARIPRYPDEVVVDMNMYAQAFYTEAMLKQTKHLAGRPDAKGLPWSDAYFAVHVDKGLQNGEEVLLIPIGMLDVNGVDFPIEVTQEGRVEINLKANQGTVYRRRLLTDDDFQESVNDQYTMRYDSKGFLSTSYQPVSKAWDESEVQRDKLGQFAPEGKQGYVVVNGKKVRVKEGSKEEKVRFASTPPARAGAERRIREARIRELAQVRDAKKRALARSREAVPERTGEKPKVLLREVQREAPSERRASRARLTMGERIAELEAKAEQERPKVAEQVAEKVNVAELPQHSQKEQTKTKAAQRGQESARAATNVKAQESVKATPPKPKFPKKPFVLPSGASSLTQEMIEKPNVPGGYRRLVVNNKGGLSNKEDVSASIGGAEEPGEHGNDPFYDRILLSEGREYYTASSLAALQEVEEALDGGGSHEIEVAGSGTHGDPYEVEYVGPAKRMVGGSIAVIKAAPKRLMLKRR